MSIDSGKCECVLFGDYVDDLNKKMGKSSGGLSIVVVQFAKIKTFRSNVVLYVEFCKMQLLVFIVFFVLQIKHRFRMSLTLVGY
jgi:hypothetical protein